jgi:hypothetical protein
MIKNNRFFSHISINKSHYLALFGTFLLLLFVPLATARAASPPLAAQAASFPGPGEIWSVIYPRLLVLLILTVFDFLFGVILAIIGKEFKWDYLVHYLNTDILPILAWMAIVVISLVPAEFIPAGTLPILEYGVYATVFLSIVASLFESFKKIGVLSGRIQSEPPK